MKTHIFVDKDLIIIISLKNDIVNNNSMKMKPLNYKSGLLMLALDCFEENPGKSNFR